MNAHRFYERTKQLRLIFAHCCCCCQTDMISVHFRFVTFVRRVFAVVFLLWHSFFSAFFVAIILDVFLVFFTFAIFRWMYINAWNVRRNGERNTSEKWRPAMERTTKPSNRIATIFSLDMATRPCPASNDRFFLLFLLMVVIFIILNLNRFTSYIV